MICGIRPDNDLSGAADGLVGDAANKGSGQSDVEIGEVKLDVEEDEESRKPKVARVPVKPTRRIIRNTCRSTPNTAIGVHTVSWAKRSAINMLLAKWMLTGWVWRSAWIMLT